MRRITATSDESKGRNPPWRRKVKIDIEKLREKLKAIPPTAHERKRTEQWLKRNDEAEAAIWKAQAKIRGRVIFLEGLAAPDPEGDGWCFGCQMNARQVPGSKVNLA